MSKAYLVLSDGTVYEGERFGADVCSTGELVFHTGVVGYLETLTDPGYHGQIILQTFPLCGNYGIIEEDFDGACAAKGYVVREWCEQPSNFRSQYTLDEYLKRQGVPGLCGVDTRAVTSHIRDHGVMAAMIADTVPEDLSGLRAFSATGGAAAVGAKETAVYAAVGEAKHRVTLVDFGTRLSVIQALQNRGCEVTVVPPDTSAASILAMAPDGVLLSNGPGDPRENAAAIGEIKQLMGRVPLFGISLGHQMMALAAGGDAIRLKYGHHGNQPVIDLKTGRIHITGQNHGYAVQAESVSAAKPSFINANDRTCEGLEYPGLGAFSVQFYPETGVHSQDTSALYDRFVDLMKEADA